MIHRLHALWTWSAVALITLAVQAFSAPNADGPAPHSLSSPNMDSPDTVIAKGKGFTVKRALLDEAWAIYKARFSRGGQLPQEPPDAVQAKLLNHIIETQILVGRATPAEKAEAGQMTEKLMADYRKRFASEDEFNNWLKTMGMSAEQYRRRTVESRTAESVIDRELKPTVSISDEQVKKYYEDNAAVFDKPEQVRARQIFLYSVDPETQKPLSDEKRNERKQLALRIKSRLDAGEDFFKLYKEFSQEAWTKEEADGDELLYVRGQLPPELDKVVFALAPGHISDVVETQHGFHIVRVSKKDPASRVPLAEAAPKLREFLVDEEVKKKLPAYLDQLRKDAAVEIVSSRPVAVK